MNRSAMVFMGLAAAAGAAGAAPPAWTFQHISGDLVNESLHGIAEVPLPPGGYIATGWRRNAAGDRDIVVLRLAPNGNLLWRRVIGVAVADEMGITVVPTFDGGFAVAGEAVSGIAAMGTYVLKLNAGGGTVWGRIYFGAPFAPGIESARIRELSNRNLVVASRYQNGGAVLSTIFMLSPIGGPVWQWGYADARYGTTQQGTLLDIIEDAAFAAPRLVAVGFTQRQAGVNREALAIAVNPATGLPVFSGVYTPVTVYDAHFNSVARVGAGAGGGGPGYGFAGRYTNVAGLASGSFLTRVDPGLLGLLGPFMAYPGFMVGRSALAWDSHPAIVGEFTLGGSEPNPAAAAPTDASLLRTDPIGVPIFQWFYGGAMSDEALALVRTVNDVGFALAGNTVSFAIPVPVAHSDLYVIKTNADGQSFCNEQRRPLQMAQLPSSPITIPLTPLGLQWTNYNPPNVALLPQWYVKCFLCPGDLNRDGVVDFNDFLEFLNLYNAAHPDADLNGDGVVDFNDFLEFLNLYNAPCP